MFKDKDFIYGNLRLIMNIRSGLPEYPLILNSLVRGVRIIKVIRFCIGFKLLNDAVGILEKDQQKRICWNRKEALNNQSPKHSSQRIFMVSEQLHYITNREEIFDLSNKKMPYSCGLWRFANA